MVGRGAHQQHAIQLTEAASSRDWRWRFVAALGRLFVEGNRNAVAATITDAPNPRAALRPPWSPPVR
jgi:hypothetical protein